MALWLVPRFDRCMTNLDRFGMPLMTRYKHWFSRQVMPYWREADHSVLHIGNEVKEKFEVALDLSHFSSEKLLVHLEAGDLTIEGKHEEKSEHGFINMPFVLRRALSKDCDPDAVHSQLTHAGHLCIDVLKTGQHTHRRTLPIVRVPKRK
ncbi:Hsp20/alpha crystallin family protein [Ancylostoma duodenale]|uniref:Hsp20/alpha crystallin family protein n=1 Tax=Ancylostoma duodenale TaxID=51022 RepID=A0A0C2DFR6_9BILA|nr:Hsp20/alpha crystallin family protein [Ancylostoma duodenale]